MEFLLSIWNWLHEYVQYTIYSGVKALIILLPLFIVVAYYTYAERKVIGYMQIRKGPNRVGPKGLFQPFADMFKLMFKEIIIPTNSNRYLFMIAPVITFRAGDGGLGGGAFQQRSWCSPTSMPGLLYILAMTSIGVYGVIIAGWASNSKYALLGAMRSAAQIVAYEIAMGFRAGRRADGRWQPESRRYRRQAQSGRSRTEWFFISRCCRCSSFT